MSRYWLMISFITNSNDLKCEKPNYGGLE